MNTPNFTPNQDVAPIYIPTQEATPIEETKSYPAPSATPSAPVKIPCSPSDVRVIHTFPRNLDADGDFDMDSDNEDIEVDICCPKCTKPLCLTIQHDGEIYIAYRQKTIKGQEFKLTSQGTTIKKRKLQ